MKRPYKSFNHELKGYTPPAPKHSYGRAVPRNSIQACLCADKLTYSKKCCKGYSERGARMIARSGFAR